jgi:predicted nucleic acid-binding protein
MDVEIASAFRRRVILGELDPDTARGRLETLSRLPIRRYPHVQLLQPMWDLRHRLTAADAAYVALALALDATLLTTDARLARAAPGARVESFRG